MTSMNQMRFAINCSASSLLLQETSPLQSQEIIEYQQKELSTYLCWQKKIDSHKENSDKAMLCYQFGSRATSFNLQKSIDYFLQGANHYNCSLSDINSPDEINPYRKELYYICILKSGEMSHLADLNKTGIISALKTAKTFFTKQKLYQTALHCNYLILQMEYKKASKMASYNFVKIVQRIEGIKKYALEHFDKKDESNFRKLSASTNFSTKAIMIIGELALVELFASNFYLKSYQDKSAYKDDHLLSQAEKSLENASLYAKIFFQLETRFTMEIPSACYAEFLNPEDPVILHPMMIKIDLARIGILKELREYFKAIKAIQKVEAKIKNMTEVFVLKKQKLSHIEMVKLYAEVSLYRAEIYLGWYKQNGKRDYLLEAIKYFSCAFNGSLRLEKIYGVQRLPSNTCEEQYAMAVLNWIESSQQLPLNNATMMGHVKVAANIFKARKLSDQARRLQQHVNKI